MINVCKATKVIFYKIHKGIEVSSDYLIWAHKLIEHEQESKSLFILSAMDKTESVFVFKEYFKRCLRELGQISIPTFEECAREIIEGLCLEIVNKTRDSFEVTKEIFKITFEIDYPVDLSVWIELDDEIARIIYDDEYYKPDEKELRARIEVEAKNYLVIHDGEDI